MFYVISVDSGMGFRSCSPRGLELLGPLGKKKLSSDLCLVGYYRGPHTTLRPWAYSTRGPGAYNVLVRHWQWWIIRPLIKLEQRKLATHNYLNIDVLARTQLILSLLLSQ